MTEIKIIIVDDHEIFRDGIIAILEEEQNIKILGNAGSDTELFGLLKSHTPDCVLLDINLPALSGIEICQILNNEFPEIKPIMLSANMDEVSVIESVKAGAYGFIPKQSSKKELLEAINTVYMGGKFFSSSISGAVQKLLLDFSSGKAAKNPDELSDREVDIIRLICDGLGYKEIGAKLYISARTVESHKNNILQKLQLDNKIELVKYAIKNNLVEL